MIITVYAPVKIVISDDRIDQLIELNAAKWKQPLSRPCSMADLVWQAFNIGIIDGQEIGAKWADCHFEDQEFYHSSIVEKRDES